MKRHLIEESPFSYFLTADTRSAVLWFVARVYIGWMWLEAGWGKLHNDAWVGTNAGQALTGFVQSALAKTGGAHPDVQGWYAAFLQNTVLPHAVLWSHMVAWGELLVGIALIVGFLVGLSAFFGIFMNLNFMLAGAVSMNPIMYTIGIGLIVAWRVAGYWGADRYVLPLLHRAIRPRIREG
jgi:thiosulfate dehydrogenase [quinone] large subunit